MEPRSNNVFALRSEITNVSAAIKDFFEKLIVALVVWMKSHVYGTDAAIHPRVKSARVPFKFTVTAFLTFLEGCGITPRLVILSGFWHVGFLARLAIP